MIVCTGHRHFLPFSNANKNCSQNVWMPTKRLKWVISRRSNPEWVYNNDQGLKKRVDALSIIRFALYLNNSNFLTRIWSQHARRADWFYIPGGWVDLDVFCLQKRLLVKMRSISFWDFLDLAISGLVLYALSTPFHALPKIASFWFTTPSCVKNFRSISVSIDSILLRDHLVNQLSSFLINLENKAPFWK